MLLNILVDNNKIRPEENTIFFSTVVNVSFFTNGLKSITNIIPI